MLHRRFELLNEPLRHSPLAAAPHDAEHEASVASFVRPQNHLPVFIIHAQTGSGDVVKSQITARDLGAGAFSSSLTPVKIASEYFSFKTTTTCPFICFENSARRPLAPLVRLGCGNQSQLDCGERLLCEPINIWMPDDLDAGRPDRSLIRRPIGRRLGGGCVTIFHRRYLAGRNHAGFSVRTSQ